MLDRLMRSAEQAEIFEIESEATNIGFRANKMKFFEVEETQGVAARVIVGGRLGFAATSDVTAHDKLEANVLESARLGDQVRLRFPAPQPGPSVQVYDPRLAQLPTERLIEIGEEIVVTLLEADDEAVVNVDLTRRLRETAVR
ncbi:MAG: DNA gyrase modulator, partial [Anaerolineae bacterium]